ncbi:hypothetical protein V1514DRAFT_323682 [Lipomyces japonicus]|uniref:uncharacterized protein n=1 Tax=Lipomyces japonicus TaxID=56871 RepID=UPI0034CEA70F
MQPYNLRLLPNVDQPAGYNDGLGLAQGVIVGNGASTLYQNSTARSYGLKSSHILVLEAAFHDNPKPNAGTREVIAERIGITTRAVQQWFQERRKQFKDQKRQESSHVEMLLASAGSVGTSISSHLDLRTPILDSAGNQSLQNNSSLLTMVEPIQENHEMDDRPNTPPISRPSSASPVKAEAPIVRPPSTPAETPTRVSIQNNNPPPPVTPIRGTTSTNESLKFSRIYASPSESPHMFLDGSINAPARTNPDISGNSITYSPLINSYSSSSQGAYFYNSPQHQIPSPIFVSTPGGPSTPLIHSTTGSPYFSVMQSPITPHLGQYVSSPTPLERTFSSPGTMSDMHQFMPSTPLFTISGAAISSESKLASRRRRQGLPPVRLRRSQSLYSTDQPDSITSMPPNSASASVSQSGGLSPARSAPGQLTNANMRRSKSVSFVPSLQPVRARKLSINTNSTSSASHFDFINSNTDGPEDVLMMKTPASPSKSNEILVEVEDHADAGRGYKRMRSKRRSLTDGEPDVNSTDEDEPDNQSSSLLQEYEQESSSVETKSHQSRQVLQGSDNGSQLENKFIFPKRLTIDTSAVSSLTSTPAATPSTASPFSMTHLTSSAYINYNASAGQFLAPYELQSDFSNFELSALSEANLTAIEQNRRLMLLTRQLDEMGILGYSALSDFDG